MTFQNLYEIYMEDMAARLKQSTLLTKKTVLQTHILPFFGSKPINEIKASDVRRWQAKLMSSPNNYSQTYLKKINTELNSIINYAKRFYDLNTNPCGKAGTIGKAKAGEMDYWTYDEYIAFRDGVKDKPDNPLLEAAGITCEVPQTQDNGSDVTIRPQFGPALVPPNTASRKIIQMPQRKII